MIARSAVVALLVAASAAAQVTVVENVRILDANGRHVASVAANEVHAGAGTLVTLKVGSDFVQVLATREGIVPTGVSGGAFFESLDCTGTPYFAGGPHDTSFVTLVMGMARTLVLVDRAAAPRDLTAHSYYGDGKCERTAGPHRIFNAQPGRNSVSLASEFQVPFHLETACSRCGGPTVAGRTVRPIQGAEEATIEAAER